MLLAAAQGGDPQNFRLSPWLFTPGLSVAFPTKEWPLEYFSNGEPTFPASSLLSGAIEQPALPAHGGAGRPGFKSFDSSLPRRPMPLVSSDLACLQ